MNEIFKLSLCLGEKGQKETFCTFSKSREKSLVLSCLEEDYNRGKKRSSSSLYIS